MNLKKLIEKRDGFLQTATRIQGMMREPATWASFSDTKRESLRGEAITAHAKAKELERRIDEAESFI